MIKGIGLTAFSSIYIVGIQLCLLAVSARILETSELGIISICGAILALSTLFIDSGLATFVIYKRDLSRKELNALLVITFIVSCVVFSIVFVAAHFIEDFFLAEGLKEVIVIYSMSFLLSPMISQFQSILVLKQMLSTLAVADVLSKTLGFILSVTLMLFEYGALSIAWGIVLASASKIMLMYFWLPREYKISKGVDLSIINEAYDYCKFQFGGQFLNYVNMYIDIFIIGRMFGIEQLGIYSLARDLIGKIPAVLGPLYGKVILPLMSKVKNDLDVRKEIFNKSNLIIILINTLTYSSVSIMSICIVEILYGYDSNVSEVIVILSLYYMIRSYGMINGFYLQSIGKVGREFYWNLFVFIVYPVMMYIFSLQGFYYFLWCMVIFQLVLTFGLYIFFHWGNYPVVFFDYYLSVFCALAISFLGIAVNYEFIGFELKELSIVVVLVVNVALCALFYKFIGKVDGFKYWYSALSKN
ncbi:oligosaccharide flippase family protein [Neptuniibacter sp. SY11_33]|uniref:oligosaccharide flippase family protein n=1 Tax=Neptuniibacter sp. SY11_33 TaxID=3398215 RepID=UPI0039F5A563